MDSSADYDFDHEFDLTHSTGPDIYGDNVDFNLEDPLIKDDFTTTNNTNTNTTTTSPTQTSAPDSSNQNNNPSLSHHPPNYHMTHQLPPKPHETVSAKLEPLEGVSSISTVDRRGSHKDPARHEAGKIFIGGLNWETTDESLRAHFSRWGEILDCSVMKEPVTGKSRGFGFLTYVDPKVIGKMLEEEHVLDGKIVDPKRAIPREEQERTEKIFVGGISPDVTEEEFSEFFGQYGSVIDATLMMDRDTGRPRGFGFITFEDDMKVDELVARNDLTIKGKVVEVKRAMPKHKAQAAKQAKDMGYGGGAMIPTFVSDARTASMGKTGNGLGVPMVPTAGRAGYGANPAAMYGAAGAMGMNGAAAAVAAKNWMAAAGMYGAGAAYGNPGAGASGAGAGGFYGFPAGAANYAGMYNPAAIAAYYQRLAASGFAANWGAAAAAGAAVGGGRAGWYPNAGGNNSVGGYDMYGGSSNPNSGGGGGGVGGAGGYGMGMMGMGGGAGMRGGMTSAGVKTERERESASRDPRQRSSRSRSPRRDQDHSPRRSGSAGRDYRPAADPSAHTGRRTSNAGGASSGSGSGRGGRYEPY